MRTINNCTIWNSDLLYANGARTLKQQIVSFRGSWDIFCCNKRVLPQHVPIFLPVDFPKFVTLCICNYFGYIKVALIFFLLYFNDSNDRRKLPQCHVVLEYARDDATPPERRRPSPSICQAPIPDNAQKSAPSFFPPRNYQSLKKKEACNSTGDG